MGGGGVLVALTLVALAVALVLRFVPQIKTYTPIGKKVAILDVRGPITSSEGLIEIIHAYRDDSTVAAVVLYIDSPGGGVAATQEIYTELLALKKKNKKVYAYMSSIGASGGYYLACAADRIYASPGTLTGSIGVIMTFTNVEGLFGKLGLGTTVVKSGRYKDIGSPFRPMTPEEEALLGETVDDVYNQFLDAVAAARRDAVTAELKRQGEKNPTKYRVRSYVREYADGRIFSGRQAKYLGFVDEVGNFQRCLGDAAKSVGIERRPTTIRKKLKKASLYDYIFGDAATRLLGLAQPESHVELKYSLY